VAPGARVTVGGLTVMEVIAATVSGAVPAMLLAASVAVTVTIPGVVVLALASPGELGSKEAMFVLDEVQSTLPVTSDVELSVKVAVAMNCCDVVRGMVVLPSSGLRGTLPCGLTAMLLIAWAVTVKTVDACIPLYVAPMLVVPVVEFVVLAKPEDELMVATDVFEEAHCGPLAPLATVTVPSVYLARTLKV